MWTRGLVNGAFTRRQHRRNAWFLRSGQMPHHVLIDILVVLLAAKAAGELAERARLPAVVGEIVAGIAIGPSALGFIGGGDVLSTFAELGVLLLLFHVGMETELADLLAVGRASLSVAMVGIALPMIGGYAAATALGYGSTAALFVGAALTATSVGITARVFGDMRALGTREARTVLGAAVADDVIGLVILTVVVGIATSGRVEAGPAIRVTIVAIGFLVVATAIGIKLVPRAFDLLSRVGRSAGTFVAVPLAFTLAVAELATAAELAPIVGAFVAGIALQKSRAAERVRRELTPIGHLFIPVFFLQIGVDANVRQFAQSRVLADASLLIVVAIAGKLASALVLRRHEGDRWLVGLGMIPRGEVGLIFATIGLQEGVFGADMYAAVLLVVLATTTLAPPLLRMRLATIRRRDAGSADPSVEARSSWLAILRPGRDSMVELAAEPPPSMVLAVALRAARLGESHRPGPKLLAWLSSRPDGALAWSRASHAELHALLNVGGPRAWRFLSVSGVLERAIPELAGAIARRHHDLSNLDPVGALAWPRLSRARDARFGLTRQQSERVALAAVILDASEGEADPLLAQAILRRLAIGDESERAVAAIVADAPLLAAAARRAHLLDAGAALQLALHMQTTEHLDAAHALARTLDEFEPWDLDQIDELALRIRGFLASGNDDAGVAAMVADRRAQATARARHGFARERIASAPREYVLAGSVDQLVRHAEMCEQPLARHEVRVGVVPSGEGTWTVEFCLRDRLGLIARETALLAQRGFDIVSADSVTWADGAAISSFTVRAARPPDAAELREALHRQLSSQLCSDPIGDVTVVFDDDVSPWHTVCRVEAGDRPGLLHDIATAFAVNRINIRAARISTESGRVNDTFALTDTHMAKLTTVQKASIENVLRGGTGPARRRQIAVRNR